MINQLPKSSDYNHVEIRRLFAEFSEYLAETHCTYIESVIGYSLIHRHVISKQLQLKDILGECEITEVEFQDRCHMLYKEIGGVEMHAVSLSPLETQGDIKWRNSKGGKNEIMAGRQAIVSLFTYWEEYLRMELAKAFKFLPMNAVKDENSKIILSKKVTEHVWGDLYYLRNSIIHYRGKATLDCERKSKIYNWFKYGDEINIDYQHMRLIFIDLAKFRNHINHLSYEPRYIQIPTFG